MGVDTKWLADRIEQLAAINEELIAERDEAWKRAGHAEKMWGETEVKLSESEALLAKAVEALHQIAGKPEYGLHPWRIARTTLAELTGGKDD